MTKLDLQVQVLKSSALLDDSQVKTITEVFRQHTIDTLNVAQFLLNKQADPDTIRMFIEDFGVSYDGKAKKFV